MTIDETAHTEQPIDLSAFIARVVVSLAVTLILAILSLYVYGAWLDVQPVSKPYVWRDKQNGNTCYIWRDSMQCIGG